jgi:fumarate reductase subunit C
VKTTADRAVHSPQALTSEVRRWAAQRLSALVLAVCVAVHLVMMIVAVRGGLSGAEILARTQGNLGFAAFYGLFVLAVAVHVPLGLATIAREWAGLSAHAAWRVAQLFGLLLLLGGARAVWAVYSGGA